MLLLAALASAFLVAAPVTAAEECVLETGVYVECQLDPREGGPECRGNFTLGPPLREYVNCQLGA